MPRVCYFTGARTKKGNKLRHRGRAKYLGGDRHEDNLLHPQDFQAQSSKRNGGYRRLYKTHPGLDTVNPPGSRGQAAQAKVRLHAATETSPIGLMQQR